MQPSNIIEHSGIVESIENNVVKVISDVALIKIMIVVVQNIKLAAKPLIL